MYLNGYYIRFVDSWDKQTKGEIKTSADAKYIKPKAENEIDDIGKVLVKIFVKKNGSVDAARTEVLHNDPRTTSAHKYHWDTARKLANQYKFEPVTSGYKLEYITITITFTSG